MTRQEHVAWCKSRALEYIAGGDAANAYASMVSDMRKHEETAPAIELMSLIGLMEARAGVDRRHTALDRGVQLMNVVARYFPLPVSEGPAVSRKDHALAVALSFVQHWKRDLDGNMVPTVNSLQHVEDVLRDAIASE